jgi:hypothetical protein
VQMSSLEDSVLALRPELSVLALSAIASWSNVELAMLHVFVQLMGGPESTAAAMYLALDGASAKERAVVAAATTALAARDSERHALRALLRLSKTHEKFRNKLAHWVWAVCPQLPDHLLLMDPRDNHGRPHKRSILAYSARDFTDSRLANETLARQFRWLGIAIGIGLDTPKRRSLVERVLMDREVAQRVKHDD